MINERYGYFECGLDGETFQVLIPIDPVFNQETGQWDDTYIFDEQTSNDQLWQHWYDVHDTDRDGNLD